MRTKGSQDAEDITQAFFARLLETDEFTRMLEEMAGTLVPDESVEEELRYLFGVFES